MKDEFVSTDHLLLAHREGAVKGERTSCKLAAVGEKELLGRPAGGPRQLRG
jgi:hypothetical protein